MKKIRMKTLGAGPDGVKHPDKEYVVSETVANELARGGYAEILGDVEENPHPSPLPCRERESAAAPKKAPARRKASRSTSKKKVTNED